MFSLYFNIITQCSHMISHLYKKVDLFLKHTYNNSKMLDCTQHTFWPCSLIHTFTQLYDNIKSEFYRVKKRITELKPVPCKLQ